MQVISNYSYYIGLHLFQFFLIIYSRILKEKPTSIITFVASLGISKDIGIHPASGTVLIGLEMERILTSVGWKLNVG